MPSIRTLNLCLFSGATGMILVALYIGTAFAGWSTYCRDGLTEKINGACLLMLFVRLFAASMTQIGVYLPRQGHGDNYETDPL